MSPGKGKLGCTVVITVKDDAEALDRTLYSLEQQTLLADEVIITVADSTDNTLAMAQKWAKKSPSTKVVSVGRATRSEGRNAGVKRSQQAIIVFIDAGCIAQRTWLENLLNPFKNQKVQLISGFTRVKNDSAFAEAQGAFVLVPLQKIGLNPLPATRNMAIRRSVFLEAGGFKNELNFAEDYEFARRLSQQGVKSAFTSSAIVEWEPRPNFSSYFQMILKLTSGDIAAGNWRFGQLSMWLRYICFSLGAIVAGVLFPDYREALWYVFFAYLIYLTAKVIRFRFDRFESYFWAILFQVCTDIAVLQGTLIGFMTRVRKKL